MRELLDEDGENRAVRTFLQLIYGGTTGSITTEKMRNHLAGSEWGAEFVPDWAKENMTLTKAGAQMWLRHLLDMETKTVIEACPFKVGDHIEAKEPNVWKHGYFSVLLDPNLSVTAVRSVGTSGDRFQIQTNPPIIPKDGETIGWADFNHFKLKEESKPIILGVDFGIIPPKFKQHSIVQHVKTGGYYHVVATPEVCKIEASGEPAYSYRKLIVHPDGSFEDGKDVWVRGQTNMEDEGRFKLITLADIAAMLNRDPEYYSKVKAVMERAAAMNKRIGELPFDKEVDYVLSVEDGVPNPLHFGNMYSGIKNVTPAILDTTPDPDQLKEISVVNTKPFESDIGSKNSIIVDIMRHHGIWKLDNEIPISIAQIEEDIDRFYSCVYSNTYST